MDKKAKFKDKMAGKSFRLLIDQYNKGIVTKNALFKLLPRKDAEAIIIGSATGKKAAEFAKAAGC